MYTAQESWKMTEPAQVVAILQDVGCWRLGTWDGCCCSSFTVRNVNVDISCGKGREQAVWISSQSLDYHNNPQALVPIMDEVIRQLMEQSGRGGTFTRYFEPYTYKGSHS